MDIKKLKRSIAVIFILMIFVALQHLMLLLGTSKMESALLVNAPTLFFTCIYFLQLNRNLRYFLCVTTIRYKVYLIMASYIIMYCWSAYATFGLKEDTTTEKIIVIFASLLIMGVFINQLVQFCLLGYRLMKSSDFPFMKKLGFTFLYLVPFNFIMIMVFVAVKSLKNYSHIFILIELLPYWFTYQLYQALIQKQNAEAKSLIITNAGAIPGEGANTTR